MKSTLLLMTAFTLIPSLVFSQNDQTVADHEKDREAIIASIVAYADAFNAKDAKALSQLWSEEGQWLNHETGERVNGRNAIEQQFNAVFAESESQRIDVAVQSIRFVADEVAVEEGIATVIGRSGTSESSYTAIHVNTSDGWKLDSVRENAVATATAADSNYEQLKELEWMIGNWVDNSADSTIETTCSWTKNRNFLTRSFRVILDEQIDLEGTQVIGWDARNGSIRSWVFDSDGGFGEGAWTRDGNRWQVRSKQTLADGTIASSVNIYTYVDENNSTWQSVNRKINGELTPSISEVRVSRISEK